MKIIINLRREILLLGSVRESIMTPSETSSEKIKLFDIEKFNTKLMDCRKGFNVSSSEKNNIYTTVEKTILSLASLL
jgi:hypothetical protein